MRVDAYLVKYAALFLMLCNSPRPSGLQCHDDSLKATYLVSQLEPWPLINHQPYQRHEFTGFED